MKPSVALITTLALIRTASAIELGVSACSGLSADQLDQEQASSESAPWETSFSTITSYALPNMKLAQMQSPRLIDEEKDTYECGDNKIGVKETTQLGEYYYQFIYLGSYEIESTAELPEYRLELVSRQHHAHCGEASKFVTPRCTVGKKQHLRGGFELDKKPFESGNAVLRATGIGAPHYHLWFPKRHDCDTHSDGGYLAINQETMELELASYAPCDKFQMWTLPFVEQQLFDEAQTFSEPDEPDISFLQDSNALLHVKDKISDDYWLDGQYPNYKCTPLSADLLAERQVHTGSNFEIFRDERWALYFVPGEYNIYWVLNVEKAAQCMEAWLHAGDCKEGGEVRLGKFKSDEMWTFKSHTYYPMNYFIKGGYFEHYTESASSQCIAEDNRFIALSDGQAVMADIQIAKANEFFNFNWPVDRW